MTADISNILIVVVYSSFQDKGLQKLGLVTFQTIILDISPQGKGFPNGPFFLLLERAAPFSQRERERSQKRLLLLILPSAASFSTKN
jgi:hypothetical protein